jgi:indole-3-glycerol phosphate synthase
MNVTGGFLEEMERSSRERLMEARRLRPEAALLDLALNWPPPPPLQPHPAGFDLIAELKLRSPAAGRLKPLHEDIAARAVAYAKAGAAAVSVLTEPTRFDGSMAHLEKASQALASWQVPAMRKDFILDPYQVMEARIAGAGGILVILRMLTIPGIRALLDCARSLGMFVLLEAFDEHDIETMHEVLARHDSRSPQPVLGGVNCRDLTTLEVMPRRLEELVQHLPPQIPKVAESGVATPADAGRVAAVGYQYALVGGALMGHANPEALAAAMLDAGRARRKR